MKVFIFSLKDWEKVGILNILKIRKKSLTPHVENGTFQKHF